MSALRWVGLLLVVAGARAEPPSFKLPDTVVPRKHTVELTIDPNQPTFEGWMRIEATLQSPADTIWLNAKGLTVKETSVSLDGRKLNTRTLTSGGEFLGFALDAPASPGALLLDIRYQGKLDEKALTGIYRRKTGGDWYAYTTFTPIEARRAFPCFDEPRFKTPWEVSLRVRSEHKAFSNARETSEAEEAGGWKLVQFAPTLPVPAEIVAFGVGPFDVFEGGIAGSSVPIRVVTPKGRALEGLAAAQSSAMVLPRLEAYTGIPYPFGKLDHLAIPDIEFSAVENPGLIIYRARSLLLPPESDFPKARPLRSLQAHEIGHQWFGNLVTQADWRDVWLSEGFATWISQKIMDMEQPSERVHLVSIAGRERIMQADTSRTRPVRTQIDSRDGATEIYNRFVYDKGAAVLLMLEGWLGEEKFRDGLRAYLNAHRFGIATTDDLAEALRGAAGVDPSRVMHAFLDTGGIPSVRADVRCDQTAELRISTTGQQTIPVCWRGDKGSACEIVEGNKTVKLAACPAWIYPNSAGTGYYRTIWPAPALAALHLRELTSAERLTLVFDLRAQKSDRSAARATLEKLLKDSEPEISAAAKDALK